MTNEKTTKFRYKSVIGKGYFLRMAEEDLDADEITSQKDLAESCLNRITVYCSELLKGSECETVIEGNGIVVYHNRKFTKADNNKLTAYWRGMRDVWGWL